MNRFFSEDEKRGFNLFTLFCACFLGKAQRQIILQGFLASVFLVISVLVWNHLYPQISSESRYLLGANRVLLLDPPPWTPPNLIQEAICPESSLSDHSLSVIDCHLGEAVVKAFKEHPWVRSVKSVRLEYPPRLLAELQFRTPVAFVEKESKEENGKISKKVFQVDSEGVLLPTDYLTVLLRNDPEAAYRYLWISGINSTPIGTYGESWGDPILDEVALLAEFLIHDFKELSIQKILIAMEDKKASGNGRSGGEGREYWLQTTRGKEIVWGAFPMGGVVGARNRTDAHYDSLKAEAFKKEMPKIEYLRKKKEEFGSLDNIPDSQLPLDLSQLTL